MCVIYLWVTLEWWVCSSWEASGGLVLPLWLLVLQKRHFPFCLLIVGEANKSPDCYVTDSCKIFSRFISLKSWKGFGRENCTFRIQVRRKGKLSKECVCWLPGYLKPVTQAQIWVLGLACNMKQKRDPFLKNFSVKPF